MLKKDLLRHLPNLRQVHFSSELNECSEAEQLQLFALVTTVLSGRIFDRVEFENVDPGLVVLVLKNVEIR